MECDCGRDREVVGRGGENVVSVAIGGVAVARYGTTASIIARCKLASA